MPEPFHPDIVPMMQAADLLAADTDNPYLIDAAGYVRRAGIQAQKTGYQVPDKDLIRNTMQMVGDYAVLAGDDQLAAHAFEQGSWSERWRLYGLASVEGATETLSEWGMALGSDEAKQAVEDVPMVKAEMQLANMQIQLAEYSTSGDDWVAARQAWDAAVAIKEEAKQELRIGDRDKYRTVYIERPKVYEGFIRPSFNEEVDSLFASHGAWDEVGLASEDFPYFRIKGGTRTVARAVAGELGAVEKLRLRSNRRDGRILIAVNDVINGADPDSFTFGHYDSKAYGIVLAAAPAACVELGIVDDNHPDVLIQHDRFEDVAGWYRRMQEYPTYTRLILTSLSMARHVEGMQAAQGAHEVYNNAFREKIEVMRDYTASQDWRARPEEAAAVEPLLQETLNETYYLKDPVYSLIAAADQVRACVDVDPKSKATGASMDQLEHVWTALERIDSYADILQEMADQLQSRGIQFRRQWKAASSTGYVGLVPVMPEVLTANAGIESDLQAYQLAEWKAAAEKLNEVHGEERYKLVVVGEPKQSKSEDVYGKVQHVRLEGSWIERGTDIWEFYAAEGLARGTESGIDTLPWLSERLAALNVELID